MRQRVFIGCLAALTAGPGYSADPAFFEGKIRPVLVEHCYACHAGGPKPPKAGLRLDTKAGLLGGGDSGPAVIPGDPDKSLLVLALRGDADGGVMPPKGKLPAAVVADFEAWVAAGAADPRGDDLAPPGRRADPWAFRPPVAVPAPPVADPSWPRGDVDRFVQAKREAAGLRPVGDADPLTWLRRVTFDLIGLPPTPDAQSAFEQSWVVNRHSSMEYVVDRLLASPAFGERWGRHWLDVARYAESTGRERNVAYKYAWRYRDYVIDGFNRDVPFDRFVREQVAGDLLPAADPAARRNQLTATGFLVLGPKGLDGDTPEPDYTAEVIDDQIEVVTKAVLGLTVSCARCHDHKYDPIPARDYAALAGVFESTRVYGGTRRGQRAACETQMWLETQPPAGARPEVVREVRELLREDGELRSAATVPEGGKKGDAGCKRADLVVAPEAKARLLAIERRLTELGCGPIEPVLAVGDVVRPADAPLLQRGDVRRPGPAVARGFLSAVGPAGPGIDPAASGRRELADWLTDRHNPLTARVFVNRVWQKLFGTGLVATVDNFGAFGAEPSHPELLDSLAVRFVDDGWSVKRLVRELVLTRTYALASDPDELSERTDAGNRFLWRMPRRRLEAEAIRDALLAAGGRLDPGRPTGSPVETLPAGELGAGPLANPVPLHEPRRCRSVYLPVVRGMVPEPLRLFDFPDPSLVVGQRQASAVATQALYFLNGPFAREQAGHLARRVLADAPDKAGRVERLFRLALGRPPTAAERELAGRHLAAADDAPAAWVELAQAVLAGHEFRTVY